MSTYNPYEAADNAVVPPSVYFGQVTVDSWPVVLVKGVRGGVSFDEATHKPEQRRTMVKLIVTPLPSSNAIFTTERDIIAESREWAGIVMPSYKALGLTLATLNEKYVKYEMVPTGRTYEAKDQAGNLTGETKQATTIKFLNVYNTLDEAEAAATAQYGGNSKQEPLATTPSSHPERDVALKFLSALAKQAGGDVSRLATILASNPLVSKYFDINSAEVIALLVPQEELPF